MHKKLELIFVQILLVQDGDIKKWALEGNIQVNEYSTMVHNHHVIHRIHIFYPLNHNPWVALFKGL
jgi:hypothetical protein